jgi:hypothetical protein
MTVHGNAGGTASLRNHLTPEHGTYQAVGNCVRRRWSTAAGSITETLAIHRGGRFGSRA